MINYIQPPLLKKGDTVAIVAPSGIVLPEKISPAEEILQSWGLHVLMGNHVFDQKGMMAGPDEQRRLDFQQMLDNHHVRAIFCARGGYGAMRIVDQLDMALCNTNPKWIIGFSDITVFHSLLHTQNGVCSIHSVMPNSFTTTNKQSLQLLHSMLFDGKTDHTIAPHTLNRLGEVSAPLVGGNLSMLYAMRGSKIDIDFGGKILFIEDIGEKLYHLDRMMQNLRLSGILEQISGLVVGQFTDMSEGSRPFGQTANEIIASVVAPYSYPVCFDYPAGHTDLNVPLMLGRSYQLRVTPLEVELC